MTHPKIELACLLIRNYGKESFTAPELSRFNKGGKSSVSEVQILASVLRRMDRLGYLTRTRVEPYTPFIYTVTEKFKERQT